MSAVVEEIPQMSGARRLGPDVPGSLRLSPSVSLFATALPQRQAPAMNMQSIPPAGVKLVEILHEVVRVSEPRTVPAKAHRTQRA